MNPYGDDPRMGFMQNTRKPVGFGGRMMIRRMNRRHEPLAVWGFESVPVRDGDDCLDIGCGGGMNVRRLLAMDPGGSVTGLDHSEVSVLATREANAKAVDEGRCTVIQGDVSAMPFEDGSFDVVTAIETVYFWPDLARSFAEVRRVMRDGATFVIVNEEDGLSDENERLAEKIEGLRIYTAEELTGYLEEAGFSDAAVRADKEKHWLCIAVRKRVDGPRLSMMPRIVPDMDSVSERIAKLKKERNAVILAHNYCLPEVQDIADKVGDSLGLSQAAVKTDADVIVFCGVSFMAETAKILNPEKLVLIPDQDAVCSMAQMCTPAEIRAAREERPGAEVIGYVNSTAACKAEMDVCCTSSNAVDIVSGSPGKDIIFVPDRNLGAYAASKNPSKDIMLWHGFCPIHQSISVGQVEALRREHPGAEVIAHPECRAPVLALADYIGSTEGMIKHCRASEAKEFIVLTEVGMRHRLEREIPGRQWWFPESAVCGAMKMATPEGVLRCLEEMSPAVELPSDVVEKARAPVERMVAGR